VRNDKKNGFEIVSNFPFEIEALQTQRDTTLR
jgi:hypothetical protein